MIDSYHQADVQQILQLAIARQAQSDEISRAQLVEIAEELGISYQDLQLAEQEWLALRGEAQERQAFNLYRRHRFRQHATKYAIINVFLVLLDFVSAHALLWSPYVLLIWGLLLALNAWKTFQQKGDEYEEAFQRWRRQRLLKQSVNTFLNRWLRVSP
jgi:hypothetical protein